MKRLSLIPFLIGIALLASGCPHHGGKGFFFMPGSGGESSASPESYKIGGTVTGLAAGQSVTVQLNNGETLVVTNPSSSFTFNSQVASGSTYNVQVTTTSAPGTLYCMADRNSGTALGSSINDVRVVCSTTTYALNVSVTGLLAGNSVTVQNNAADGTKITSNGTVLIDGFVPSGAGYSVTVKEQPTATPQICTPSSSNTGTMTGAKTVNVKCVLPASAHSIGGSYTGLNGTGLKLVLQETGEELLFSNSPPASPSSATNFTFTQKLADLTDYHVIVKQNPANLVQTCVVTNGNGTLAGADITNVSVTCTTSSFTIGGAVTGLAGTESVTLQLNGGADQVAAVGTESFSWPKLDGTHYSVTVSVHPLHKTCSVTHGTGTLAGTNVTNVQVSCAFSMFTVGGAVNGLCAGQSVTLKNNGGDDIIWTQGDANFAFPFQNDHTGYNVTVSSPPSGVSCTVVNGTSSINGANVTNVQVNCSGCMACAGTGTLTVTWQASRSYDVDTASGGGHKVYYQTSTGVSKATPTFADVANSTSKTQTTISGLKRGCTYYVKVGGYSAINPTGGNLSAEMFKTVQ